VATYSILPIGQFFVVAQIIFFPLAPWPVFLQKAVCHAVGNGGDVADEFCEFVSRRRELV